MKKLKSFLIAAAFLALPAVAQQVNSLYFLDNVPFQTYINPAMQLGYDREGYVALPVIGYGQFSVGNNSLAVKNLLFSPKGQKQLVSFLHPQYGSKDKFLRSLRQYTLINADYQINLLGFGFKYKEKNYWTVGITERIEAGLTLPKDLFKFGLYGTPIEDGENNYNLKSLGISSTVYTEIGVGYARQVNDNLSVGGRVKFLLGTENITFKNKALNLTAGTRRWDLDAQSSLAVAGPVQLKENFGGVVLPSNVMDYIKPAGYGAAFDLGVDWKFFDKKMRLTAGITDLGFIYWNKGTKMLANGQFSFDGFEVDGGDIKRGFKVAALGDSLKKEFNFDSNFENQTSPYATMPTMKINIGYEYDFYKEMLGLGLLSRTMLFNNRLYEELTASFIVKPVSWFNWNLSYSFVNGRSSIGTGIGLRAGPILFFVAADYIPMSYTTYQPSPESAKVGIPYNSKGFNLAGGITIVWGNSDKDKDGVRDRKDQCPDTPLGVEVDSVGCPLDEDKDGVPDYLDECPGTPEGVEVDSVGCPIDSDKDGVPDYLDECPYTPEGVEVDSEGCPLDEDGDGVPDYKDECPGTPDGVEVYDNGCPIDSDGDGVPDYLDKCPGTPKGIEVDSVGCPFDEDGDGVPDYLDQCPGTPKEARGKVDEKGCLLDTDGDGVPDYLDQCPTVAGSKTNNGCPELKKDVKKLFNKALQGIQFENGKATIKKNSYPILDQIVKVMKDNPTYSLEIFGHTDNVGKPESNMKLSDDRANSVKTYLVQKGVDPMRVTSAGYGDTKPVADNKTAKGRAQNRRVEFNVKFEQIVQETVNP